MADTPHYAVGEAGAVDLLSQWEGFGRFCRDSLGVEPPTAGRAFGVGTLDPAAEVRAAYPDATFAAAAADDWAGQWARSRVRRFATRQA